MIPVAYSEGESIEKTSLYRRGMSYDVSLIIRARRWFLGDRVEDQWKRVDGKQGDLEKRW